MKAYFDLMILAHLILNMVSISFVRIIDCYRMKWRGVLKLNIATFYFVFFVYFDWWLSLLLILLLYGLIFFLFFKQKLWRPLFEFLACYVFLMVSLSLFSKGLTIRSCILVVEAPSGFLMVFLAPLFYLILLLVSKGIDVIYRLGNYKVDAILNVEGKKAEFKCYFDTGNTLKHDGVPVIFCIKDAWPFNLPKSETYADIETVNGSKTMPLTKGLITFSEKKTSVVVYVAVVEQDRNFNGCECLLNAYLV